MDNNSNNNNYNVEPPFLETGKLEEVMGIKNILRGNISFFIQDIIRANYSETIVLVSGKGENLSFVEFTTEEDAKKAVPLVVTLVNPSFLFMFVNGKRTSYE